ncbi:hypothetical protein ACHAXA_000109, partial [Cyclostephanos tholiformis]
VEVVPDDIFESDRDNDAAAEEEVEVVPDEIFESDRDNDAAAEEEVEVVPDEIFEFGRDNDAAAEEEVEGSMPFSETFVVETLFSMTGLPIVERAEGGSMPDVVQDDDGPDCVEVSSSLFNRRRMQDKSGKSGGGGEVVANKSGKASKSGGKSGKGSESSHVPVFYCTEPPPPSPTIAVDASTLLPSTPSPVPVEKTMPPFSITPPPNVFATLPPSFEVTQPPLTPSPIVGTLAPMSTTAPPVVVGTVTPSTPPPAVGTISPSVVGSPSLRPISGTPPPASTRSTCPDTLDQSTVIDSSATLYYAVVPSDPAGSSNGLLCGRIEVENDGWIGIGFSTDGLMAGSQAVIGIPAEGTVLKYDLTSTATLMNEERQTLTNTSIAEVDGLVIMEFVKLLVEEGEVPILEGVENIFIHARGLSELGYHSSRISSVVVLSTVR